MDRPSPLLAPLRARTRAAQRAPRAGFPAAWLAALLTCAAAAGIWWPPQAWPSSDLEGHLATIRLYADGLAQGIVWPYDHTAACGCDAIPYYGWVLELALGACALALGILGVADPALVVAVALTVLALALLPLAAAWCAGRCAAAAGANAQDRALARHAGALAAWTFLACDGGDGFSGYGMAAVGMAVLPQLLGWSLVLWVAGEAIAARPAGYADPRLALALAATALCHALSALAAALVVAPLLLRQPRRLLLSGLWAAAGAAAALASVAVAASRLTPERPWNALSGSDPLLALVAPLVEGGGWSRLLPGAGSCCGLALLAAALAAARAQPAVRMLLSGAGLLAGAALLPLAHLLLPAACQPYRLAPPALLLTLVAGAGALPACLPWWRARVRPALATAVVAAVWLGLGVRQAAAWPRDAAGATPAAVLAELPAPPAGARVLWTDAIGWHRTAGDVWKLQRCWESAGCLHTTVLGPVAAALAPAAAALGCGLCALDGTPPPEPAVAAAELRDAGITHCLRSRGLQHQELASIAPVPAPPRSWRHWRSAHLDCWELPDPAPRLEPLGTLIAWALPAPPAVRGLLAEWWSRTRARLGLSARLVLTTADDPLVAAALVPAAADAEADAHADAADADADADAADAADADAGDDPQQSRRSRKRGGPRPRLALAIAAAPARCCAAALVPGGGMPAIAAWWYGACAPAPRWLSLHDGGAPPLPAGTTPSCTWLDGNTVRLDALEPGRPYLLRYGYSRWMRCDHGRLLEEAGGMTVVVPERRQTTVTVAVTGPGLRAALVLSVLTMATLAALSARALNRPRPAGAA